MEVDSIVLEVLEYLRLLIIPAEPENQHDLFCFFIMASLLSYLGQQASVVVLETGVHHESKDVLVFHGPKSIWHLS